jgi:hypothetical protein
MAVEVFGEASGGAVLDGGANVSGALAEGGEASTRVVDALGAGAGRLPADDDVGSRLTSNITAAPASSAKTATTPIKTGDRRGFSTIPTAAIGCDGATSMLLVAEPSARAMSAMLACRSETSGAIARAMITATSKGTSGTKVLRSGATRAVVGLRPLSTS